MPDSQQKRKSPVKTIIKREEWHFKFEAARLIRSVYLKKSLHVPKSVHDHYTTLTDLFQKHKADARETAYIKLGKRWIKDLLESSPEFGKNTSLYRLVHTEFLQKKAYREQAQKSAEHLFRDPARQKDYVRTQMQHWEFSNSTLQATNREQAEQFCPTYRPQFSQHERNVRNTILRAFEAVQYAINGVKIDQKHRSEQAPPQPSVIAREEAISIPAIETKNWGKRPSEAELPALLRNNCDDNYDDSDDFGNHPEEPKPITRQVKYIQPEFSFMQRTRDS